MLFKPIYFNKRTFNRTFTELDGVHMTSGWRGGAKNKRSWWHQLKRKVWWKIGDAHWGMKSEHSKWLTGRFSSAVRNRWDLSSIQWYLTGNRVILYSSLTSSNSTRDQHTEALCFFNYEDIWPLFTVKRRLKLPCGNKLTFYTLGGLFNAS